MIRMFRKYFGGLAASLALAVFPLRGATLPAGFVETQFGGNLGGAATAMAFAPDGRLFVCLQGGQLRVIKNGALLPTPFVSLSVNSSGERGLLGVAFDPSFSSNQFVYIYYTTSASPIHNRISRFTANGDVAAAGSEVVLMDLDNLSSATNHNGGAIHFGPDGKLYAGVGENANSANAQTLNNRLGKILRINSDGTIPTDNPFFGTATGPNRAIWALGLRNPFTFGFQPGTGRMFVNDVGQNTWEEINDGIAGSNYGWPTCEGACSPSNQNFRDPLFQYGHGTSATTGCAIVGAAFYNPAVNQFPASYVGKYFFGDLCSGWIRTFDPSAGTASDFATGIATLVDLKVGPEGSLYYLAQGNGGQVWKVSATATPTPTPSSTPSPTATPTATPGATPTPTPAAAQTLNLSTRLRAETGDKVMIEGFIITGQAAKSVVLRGMGPSLASAGLVEVLANPTLDLRGSDGMLIMQNNNWKEGPRDLIEGTPFQPTDDREAVIVASLQPGAYTAILTGEGQTTGVGLLEIYDKEQTADSQLANISTRGFVQTGDNVMIGGFILGGGRSNSQVAVRGIGPSLGEFGLSNLLADPSLELHDSNGTTLIANDDWQDDPVSASQLTFHNLALRNSQESGIFTSLPPGAFTAILAGAKGGTGIALLEIYDIQ